MCTWQSLESDMSIYEVTHNFEHTVEAYFRQTIFSYYSLNNFADIWKVCEFSACRLFVYCYGKIILEIAGYIYGVVVVSIAVL